jgi:hypothetical protein
LAFKVKSLFEKMEKLFCSPFSFFLSFLAKKSLSAQLPPKRHDPSPTGQAHLPRLLPPVPDALAPSLGRRAARRRAPPATTSGWDWMLLGLLVSPSSAGTASSLPPLL